jgi:hypothetical protein
MQQKEETCFKGKTIMCKLRKDNIVLNFCMIFLFHGLLVCKRGIKFHEKILNYAAYRLSEIDFHRCLY